MALTLVDISDVNPRGGVAATPLTIDGDGFGAVQGRVVFDPLGVNIDGTVTAWGPNQILVTVPAGLPDNQFVTLFIETDGAADGGSVPFWVPAAVPSSDGLDYQYPSFEEGPLENADDPRLSEAADFNRMLVRVLNVVAGVGDMTKAVYDQNNNSIVDLSEALDDSGTPRTWADIVALFMLKSVYDANANGIVDNSEAIDDNGTPRTWADIVALVSAPATVAFPTLERKSPSAGQTSFSIASAPQLSTPVIFMVNGLEYEEGAGKDYTVAGTAITWLNNEFTLETSDRVTILYFV